MESQPGTSRDKQNWQVGQNEYTQLHPPDSTEAPGKPEGIIRSARDLESYKRIFGENFGLHEELILDVGAGDATMADEIEALTDHDDSRDLFCSNYPHGPIYGCPRNSQGNRLRRLSGPY